MDKLRKGILDVLDYYSVMLDQEPIADDIIKLVVDYMQLSKGQE